MWEPTSPTSPTAPAPSIAQRQKNPGRRFAQIVKLRPQHVAEYKACHAAVWPEVLQQIKECNIEDYSIWLDDATGTLFASLKYVGYDYEGDMEKMRANPKVREWWKMTDGFQESVNGGRSSEDTEGPSWWKPLEEVFYYNPSKQ